MKWGCGGVGFSQSHHTHACTFSQRVTRLTMAPFGTFPEFDTSCIRSSLRLDHLSLLPNYHPAESLSYGAMSTPEHPPRETRSAVRSDRSSPEHREISPARSDATTLVDQQLFHAGNKPEKITAPPDDPPPQDGIDGGLSAWTFLAGSFLVEIVATGPAFSFSVFQDYLTRSGSSIGPFPHIYVSAIGAILTGCIYCIPAVAQPLWLRFENINRRMNFGCVVLASASLLAASFCRDMPALIVLIGLVPGSCAGLSTISYMLWLPQHFVKRRGLANGVAFCEFRLENDQRKQRLTHCAPQLDRARADFCSHVRRASPKISFPRSTLFCSPQFCSMHCCSAPDLLGPSASGLLSTSSLAPSGRSSSDLA